MVGFESDVVLTGVGWSSEASFESARTTVGEPSSGMKQQQQKCEERRFVSVFDVSDDFFDGCRLLPSPSSSIADEADEKPAGTGIDEEEEEEEEEKRDDENQQSIGKRWTCNACKVEFEALLEQRTHFKSDFHRLNIKLSIAGKPTVREEDFDELNSDSLLKDFDVSSISGSDEEDERQSLSLPSDNRKKVLTARKLYVCHRNGNKYSMWKCLLLDDSDNVFYGNENSDPIDSCTANYFTEVEVIEKLNRLVREPRDKARLRVVLLASGGHFAGCVFDGNTVVAHKTFHRYVVRAKAGKKQSSKDASGRAIHSAGASLRRYNELALKKNIQELLALWKPYFDASACTYVSAPSDNRQLLFSGDKPLFSHQHVRNVPLTVRRPTLKETRRIYHQLTLLSQEVDVNDNFECLEFSRANENPNTTENTRLDDCLVCNKVAFEEKFETLGDVESSLSVEKFDQLSLSTEQEPISRTTPLHEAAHLGKADEVMVLLEQGLDPCVKDERGRTPYMVATDKEVRNTFRRFMADNREKWDWQAANVPSILTKEMEEAQAAKQAEKDAKRKARAKELKKLKKAKEKEKKAQEQIAIEKAKSEQQAGASSSKKQTQLVGGPKLSKEEELKRAQDVEREKRAQAAEKRMMAAAAAAAQGSYLLPYGGAAGGDGGTCSCCSKSLTGLVPFHRYNYKYCCTSCMRVHKELIESGA